MKNRFHFGLLAALALLAGCSKPGADAPKDAASDAKTNAAATGTVTLDAAAQTRIGLKVQNLAAAEWLPEVRGFGHVLDTAALPAAVAELAAAQSTADLSRQELARLKTLAQQGNASERALQAAQAAAGRDALAQAAAREKFILNWGRRLAEAAEGLRPLLADGVALVRLDLAAGGFLKAPPRGARLVPLEGVANAVSADYFDTGSAIDPQTQQQLLLFTIRQKALPPGAAVTGFVRLDGTPIAGVAIPADGVVRHDAKAWIYLQTGESAFARHEIPLDRPTEGGWFSSELSPTNRMVVVGAQVLLSEELKGQGEPE
jgi:hypothetical protein